MKLNEEIRKQKNVELRKRVYRVLQSMYRLFRGSPVNTQIVDRYMNIWKPLSGDVEDVVQFPYESKKGSMAEKKNTTHCLFALVTTMIKRWHLHCKGIPGYVDDLETDLDKIELIVKGDLKFPVRGSDVTGYYLLLGKGKG